MLVWETKREQTKELLFSCSILLALAGSPTNKSKRLKLGFTHCIGNSTTLNIFNSFIDKLCLKFSLPNFFFILPCRVNNINFDACRFILTMSGMLLSSNYTFVVFNVF